MFDLSCAFATSMATPDHVAVAESLGYRRAWLYDSPALYPDVWVTLARCAERTSTIGLGPGVLIPSLRHPMANAAAIATLVDLAGPDRVAVAVGTGFTGRFTLGQKPLRWSFVADYVRVLRALLRGEVVEWEGAKMQMIHPPASARRGPSTSRSCSARPGRRGLPPPRTWPTASSSPAPAVRRLRPTNRASCSAPCSTTTRTSASERVMAAAGHGAAVYYHFWFETGRSMEDLPQGAEWVAAYADVPADERHLAIHDRHLIALNDRDRAFVTPEILAGHGRDLPSRPSCASASVRWRGGHDRDRLPARRTRHPPRARGLRRGRPGVSR